MVVTLEDVYYSLKNMDEIFQSVTLNVMQCGQYWARHSVDPIQLDRMTLENELTPYYMYYYTK